MNFGKNSLLYSLLSYIFFNIYIITIINKNFVSSYYILPFKTYKPSLSDLYQLNSNMTDDELFLIYLKKNSIITSLKVNDSFLIKGSLESSLVCSYLEAGSCLSDIDFNNKINHINVNLSNIFELIDENYKIKLEEDKCLNLRIGLGITQSSLAPDCISFIDEVKKNDNTIKTYSWSLIYYDSNNKNKYDFDGEILIGIEPHDYQPFIYNKKNYVTINNYIDGDSYYFPMFEKNEYGIQFNTIYFYKNNKIISENLVQLINPTSMEGLFSLNFGMIQCPEEYFTLIKNNFFNQYINICKEVSFYDEYRFYYSFVCDKNQLNLDEFYKNFPVLYFKHIDLNYIFELNAKELFIEERNKLYFMIFSSDIEKWYFGEIFLKKYFFSFNQNKKSISFYINMNKNDNENKDDGNKGKKTGTGIILLIIGIGLIVINIIIFGIFFYKKSCENNRRRRANELKDDNYDYLPEDNSNQNKNKIINDD